MQYKNAGGQWVNIGSAGSGGSLGSMSDVNANGAEFGSILMYNGSQWSTTSTSTIGLLAASVVANLQANQWCAGPNLQLVHYLMMVLVVSVAPN